MNSNSVRVLTTLQQLKSIKSSWLKLEKIAQVKSVFNSYDWVETWATHYQEYIEKLLILTYWKDDELCCLIPLYVKPKCPYLAFYISSYEPAEIETCSEAQDFMSLSHDTLIPPSLFIHHMFVERVRQIRFSNLSSSSFLFSWLEKVGGFKSYRRSRVRFCVKGTEGLSILERKTRRNRKAAEKCNMTVKKVARVEEFYFIFEELVRLNSKRWLSKGLPAIFLNEPFLSFHRELAEKLLTNNLLSLYYLQFNEQIIAVNYGVVSGDNIIFYQNGVDTEFKPNVSPGMILHLAQINEAMDSGYKAYDLMSSSDEKSYKSRFANYREDVFNVIYSPSAFQIVICAVFKFFSFIKDKLS